MCGTAVETAMNTVVVVDLIKGQAPAVAARGDRRPPDDHRLGAAAGGRVPDEPARPRRLDRRRCSGSTTLDAYQLVSQAGLAPVGNVVDTNYTMVAKLPKAVLGGVSAYDGLHRRLRAVGAEYLRTPLSRTCRPKPPLVGRDLG